MRLVVQLFAIVTDSHHATMCSVSLQPNNPMRGSAKIVGNHTNTISISRRKKVKRKKSKVHTSKYSQPEVKHYNGQYQSIHYHTPLTAIVLVAVLHSEYTL
jgi:hypothetical protein